MRDHVFFQYLQDPVGNNLVVQAYSMILEEQRPFLSFFRTYSSPCMSLCSLLTLASCGTNIVELLDCQSGNRNGIVFCQYCICNVLLRKSLVLIIQISFPTCAPHPGLPFGSNQYSRASDLSNEGRPDLWHQHWLCFNEYLVQAPGCKGQLREFP